jgi:phage terminase large subunit-like protein
MATRKQLEEAHRLALMLDKRRKEEHLRYFRPFEKQQEFHLCGKRNAWALGGNRTGKTEGGASKATIYALGNSARRYMADWPEDLRNKYEPLIARFGGGKTRGWIGSVSFEVQRDVTQKKIFGDPEAGTPGILPMTEVKRVTYRIKDVIDLLYLKNGSTIGFKSYDQGRAKFQGTSQHWIWLDEEPPKDIYTECLMRLMDTEGDLVGTMTPLQGLTFVYDDIYLNESKPIEKQDKEIFCIFMSWGDNPYLSGDEIRRLESTLDPNELEARKYGRFIMPGKCSFDVKRVQEGLEKSCPGERGNIVWTDDKKTKVKWLDDPQGEYEVWFHPSEHDEYLLPGDVAEGLEHGDFSALGAINRTKNRLDAVYHGHVDPDVLSDYIHRMAIYYGTPLVAPEGNNHGLTTISFLKLVYQDIYRFTVYDKTNDEEREKLGWYTTPKTRPLVVDAIKRAVREGTLTIYWRRFWDEAMNFVRWPNGKEAAREGYWDDAVMMMGIGAHIHNTSTMTKDLPAPSTSSEGREKAGWHTDKDGKETFVHPSIIEDRRRSEWGEDGF